MHGKFYERLGDSITVGMDRQLFDIIKEDYADLGTTTALNPVARQALILIYGQNLIAPLGLVAGLVLGGGGCMDDTKETSN